MIDTENLVPKGIPNYIKFGEYDDILRIVNSNLFLPIFMSGLSRSGKTCMIEQVCHETGREMIRVNITEQTEEDDLIGGFRLQDGNTVWFDGPATVAVKRGSILLLDEADLGSNKIMCLQPILEGSSLYLKKIGKVIHPKKGFNILATGNTKGQGDIRGKFVGTQVMNEAFLERFALTFEHNYPPANVEKAILSSYLPPNGVDKRIDSTVVEKLVEWGIGIRKNYEENVASDLVSTGRLIHIIRAYVIFRNPFKAVKLGISRFDDNMKDVFYEMFKKGIPLEEEDFNDDGSGGSKSFIKKQMDRMDISDLKSGKKWKPARVADKDDDDE